MSEPIWRTPDTVTDARLMRFLAGEDVLLDRELLPYDIRASAAHAEGLATLGILDDAGLAGVLRELHRREFRSVARDALATMRVD